MYKNTYIYIYIYIYIYQCLHVKVYVFYGFALKYCQYIFIRCKLIVVKRCMSEYAH